MHKRLTEAELAVLGLVAENPRHGYELQKVIHERGMHEWLTLGFSSIYYVLEKLEAAELVKAELPQSAKGQKIFGVTEKGRTACANAAAEAITAFQPMSSSLLLGIANSPLLSEADFVAALKQRQILLDKRIKTVADTQRNQQPLPDFVDAIFDYNSGLLQAERTWLAAMLAAKNSMEKIDFKKKLKELYNPSGKDFSIVNVPKMSFLMIDGQGNPNTSASYKEAVEALYAVAYAIKFMSKKQLGKNYGVLPLEGLWTANDHAAFTARAKDSWHWTMMIMQPEWIDRALVDAAIEAVKQKKNPAALALLRFEQYDEGKAVQIMHVGSYDDEAPTLQKLHTEFLPHHSLTPAGKHHEIYLGDPRKTEPTKLKTVLRQPVR